MTGYSSSVNGENKTKSKDKARVFHDKDVARHDEDVRHDKAVVPCSKEEAN